jgi:hypothetical protein
VVVRAQYTGAKLPHLRLHQESCFMAQHIALSIQSEIKQREYWGGS